ncbi:hypothetical protein PTSG_00011 [Salpingoeca rosetta]|uniref:Exportin-T n=1 Tax=Salpingoeca rosetta (strain ATCC 50818 / BSB-021) TaxID=946362 RepID=F2TV99_SALR5|nr:uncharacterized protein PTSG_00011 [Salpingoeca rosetta]EGD71995.1 hypothetical protein PTSG_00011 [Salpingoeca rosetta]|eukprot:XP_004998567.1 hypothetical protein PTSG_00011 [Salpingoeca rosetta]
MNGLHVDMDGFIEAVRVSCDAMAHPDLRSKALEHIAELEAAPATWIMCMDGLSNSYWETLESQFYSFKVIEKAVRHRYPSLTAEEQQALREFLMSYMRTHDLSQPALIRNKVAQIFALVFVQDYPGSWPTFFQDVIEHVSEQAPADLFLRILQAIDEQVAATEISRNAEEAEASAALKDAMREYDLSRIAQAWLTIITTFATPAPELAAHCLDVIATYILWIDVNLIVNQHFQQALHECVRVGSPVREAACRVIDAALTKGMPAAGRLAVVDELRVGDVLERICSDAELQADADLMTEVAAIVNTLLTTLIGGLAELAADSPEIAATHATVRRILPIALMLFGADDDGVSERVIHGINTYLHHLKQRSELGEAEAATFAVIADKALMKMQFDGEDEFENEEALALFLEFRVQLKSVLVNLSHIDLQRLLAVAAAVVSHLLSPSEDHPWQRVELGLHIVFVMQEIGAGVPLDDGEDSSEGAGHPMRSMLEQAVHYPVSHACPEPLLQQYFEVLGRASKFLARDVDRLMPALGTFFSAAGMQHPSSRLRSRCCYLLCTVLRDKSVRETATALIPEIVEHLLPYFHPSGMQEEQGRLNLLEAVSWLLAHHSISMEEKVYRIGQFVDPMVSAFSAKLEEAVHAPGTAAQQEQRCATLVYLINAVILLGGSAGVEDGD